MLYTEIQVHCLSLVFYDTTKSKSITLVSFIRFSNIIIHFGFFCFCFFICLNLYHIFRDVLIKAWFLMKTEQKKLFCKFLAHQNNLLCTCDIFSGNNIIHSVFFRSFNNLNKFSLRVSCCWKKEACAQPLGPLIEYLS